MVKSIENKKVINAQVSSLGDIKFKSKLELRAYELFSGAGLNINPTPEKISLQSKFSPNTPYYVVNKKKKQLECNNYVVREITYTPDFIIYNGKYTWYIETKGFRTDSYKIKVKLFRKYLENIPNSRFAEIYTKRDMLNLIEIINNEKENTL